MICDSHIHSKDGIEKSESTFEALAKIGVTEANILSVTWNEFPIENNITALYFKEKCKQITLRAFAGLYYDKAKPYDFYSQAKMLLNMGFDGIKLLEMKPNYRKITGFGINAPCYDKMFDMAEKEQIPIWAHVADPRNFWDKSTLTEEQISRGWFYGDGTFLSREELYRETFERLEKNPKLIFTFCHFGFMSDNISLAENILETYPNVCFDLTPGWEIYVDFSRNIGAWKAFFEKYSHRIFFGTDSNCRASAEYLKKLNKTVFEFLTHDGTEFEMPHKKGVIIKGMNLSPEARDNILFKNYEKMFCKKKDFNISLFKKHFDEIYNIVSSLPDADERLITLNKIKLDLGIIR